MGKNVIVRRFWLAERFAPLRSRPVSRLELAPPLLHGVRLLLDRLPFPPGLLLLVAFQFLLELVVDFLLLDAQFDGLLRPFLGGFEIARLGVGGGQRAEDVGLLVLRDFAGLGGQLDRPACRRATCRRARWPAPRRSCSARRRLSGSCLSAISKSAIASACLPELRNVSARACRAILLSSSAARILVKMSMALLGRLSWM